MNCAKTQIQSEKPHLNTPLSGSHHPFLLVDAIYLKVREDGSVQSRGVMIAVRINRDGYREVLGMTVGYTESESSWSEFVSSRRDSGLHDVNIITSYNHRILARAIRQHFCGVA